MGRDNDVDYDDGKNDADDGCLSQDYFLPLFHGYQGYQVLQVSPVVLPVPGALSPRSVLVPRALPHPPVTKQIHGTLHCCASLFVLRFYSPVNTIKVMLRQSVNLLTA